MILSNVVKNEQGKNILNYNLYFYEKYLKSSIL